MPTALIGTALSLGGSLLSNNASNAANQNAADAAQFNPFNISGAGGNVTFQDGAASVTGSQQQRLANMAMNLVAIENPMSRPRK